MYILQKYDDNSRQAGDQEWLIKKLQVEAKRK